MIQQAVAALAFFCATAAFAAVDVNKASEAELDAVKGIGPSTTRRILAERKKAEFNDWGDFMARVKGMRESRAAKLSGQGVTVAGTSYAAPAAAPKK